VNRRETIRAFLWLGIAVAPLPSPAQSPRRIGVLHRPDGCFIPRQSCADDFVRAMKELGYVEGRHYLYDFREWQSPTEIENLVRDLVRQNVAVIIAATPPSIMGAKNVTNIVPIVFAYSAEPVAMGLARSLAQPGGNLTGLTWDHGFEFAVKGTELLKETLPHLQRIAYLWDGTDSVHPIYAKYYEKAALQLAMKPISLEVRTADDLKAAFARAQHQRAEAVIVLPSAQLTLQHREAIMALASRVGLPALGANVLTLFPNALLHYGPNHANTPRRLASYVDRIFKGARPSELPIEQPDKYDLIVDLTVAKKLGIKIPNSILVRADRIIK
jgi:putative tryptophan/tyrosine transport system substrate-binding protein